MNEYAEDLSMHGLSFKAAVFLAFLVESIS